MTVKAATAVSLTLSANSVVGGNTVEGTYTLDGKAPAGGALVVLGSSDTDAATVPPSVTIPENATSVHFQIATAPLLTDRNVVISGTYRGTTRTAALTVIAQNLQPLVLSPNPALGGVTVAGTVSLSGPSVGDTLVSLSSNSGSATVPATVIISNGETSATFNIQTSTVQVETTATIFASAGPSSVQTPLIIQPLTLTSFTLSSTSVYEGLNVTGSVAINGPAPAGGVPVQLSQTNGSIATIPASVTIPQGQSSTTFTISAKQVSTQQSTTITATLAGTSINRTLTVKPITISSFQLTNNSVTGGTVVQAVIQIVAPAPPGGYAITLSSSDSSAASVPSSVTIPAGATSAIFSVTTHHVNQVTFVTLTATHGQSSRSVQLQVVP